MKDMLLAAATLVMWGGCIYLFIIKVAEYATTIN